MGSCCIRLIFGGFLDKMDYSWAAMSGSHYIRTVSGMFHNMSMLTLSPLVSLSDLASFAVERCAARSWAIYVHDRAYHDHLSSQHLPTVRVCILRPVTSLRVSLLRGFVCSHLSLLTFGAGLLYHIFVIYTHRHTHGRPVIISLW